MPVQATEKKTTPVKSFDAGKLITTLSRFPASLNAILTGVGPLDARWKPDPKTWSLLEIVCHLVDEEVDDFRTRLFCTLNEPETPWPAIDPEGWVIEREYAKREPREQLDAFIKRRATSIELLRASEDANWDSAYVHPRFGPINAGQLLVAWVEHDLLHMRQITKRLYELTRRDGAAYLSPYAGEW